MAMRKAGVLTGLCMIFLIHFIYIYDVVSDKCSKGEAEDTSGPNLIRLLVDWQE